MEHTADIAVRAQGGTLEELFANCAQGMFAYIFGDKLGSEPALRFEEVGVESGDLEATLVEWLSLLLYHASVTRQRAWRFEQIRVSASGCGCRVGFALAQAQNEIKAVTYHGLKIERCGAGWSGRVGLT